MKSKHKVGNLNSLLKKVGTSLSELTESFPAVCLVGSRAAGCATEYSDYDLIVFFDKKASSNKTGDLSTVLKHCGYDDEFSSLFEEKSNLSIIERMQCSESNFGYGLKKKISGLDLMFEDMNCPHWFKRELCIHTSKYGIWLSGEKFWKDEKIDWKGASNLKEELISKIYESTTSMAAQNERNDRKRLFCIQNKIHVPPTAMLDSVISQFQQKPKVTITVSGPPLAGYGIEDLPPIPF